MPNRKKIFCSIKKEFCEFYYNKASLFLNVFAFSFVIFLPFVDQQFMNVPEEHRNKIYVFFSLIVCVFVVTQRLFDGLKNDFSSGGAIFLINSGCSCHVYLLGKKLVSFAIVFLLLVFRLKEFLSFFSVFNFILLFVFFDFVIDNTFLFSMFFYTKNENILAYLFIMVLPVMMLPLIILPKFAILKIIILSFFIIIENKQVPRIYNSRRFRFNLS